MSRASKQLMESKDPQEHALGAYIHSRLTKQIHQVLDSVKEKYEN